MLVVRAVRARGATAGANIVCAATQSLLGSSLGTVSPLITGYTKFAGLHYYQDTATAITPDFIMGLDSALAMWPHEFPVCILQPGWAFAVQGVTAAQAIAVSFVWEALDPADVLFREMMDQP
jgi:hypothetical protein